MPVLPWTDLSELTSSSAPACVLPNLGCIVWFCMICIQVLVVLFFLSFSVDVHFVHYVFSVSVVCCCFLSPTGSFMHIFCTVLCWHLFSKVYSILISFIDQLYFLLFDLLETTTKEWIIMYVIISIRLSIIVEIFNVGIFRKSVLTKYSSWTEQKVYMFSRCILDFGTGFYIFYMIVFGDLSKFVNRFYSFEFRLWQTAA